MERERCDLAEDLGWEVPERREAAARAAAAIILRREHQGESVEVLALVVRPASSGNHFLEIPVICLGGEICAGAQEDGVEAGTIPPIVNQFLKRCSTTPISRVHLGASSQQQPGAFGATEPSRPM